MRNELIDVQEKNIEFEARKNLEPMHNFIVRDWYTIFSYPRFPIVSNKVKRIIESNQDLKIGDGYIFQPVKLKVKDKILNYYFFMDMQNNLLKKENLKNVKIKSRIKERNYDNLVIEYPFTEFIRLKKFTRRAKRYYRELELYNNRKSTLSNLEEYYNRMVKPFEEYKEYIDLYIEVELPFYSDLFRPGFILGTMISQKLRDLFVGENISGIDLKELELVKYVFKG